jgi:hypothetical protein
MESQRSAVRPVKKGRAERSLSASPLTLLSPDWRAGQPFPRGRCALTRGSSPFVSAVPRSLRGLCFPVFLDGISPAKGLDPGAGDDETAGEARRRGERRLDGQQCYEVLCSILAVVVLFDVSWRVDGRDGMRFGPREKGTTSHEFSRKVTLQRGYHE